MVIDLKRSRVHRLTSGTYTAGCVQRRKSVDSQRRPIDRQTYPSIPSQMIDIPNERLDPRRDWTSPGRAPEAPDADLTGEGPTIAKRGCLLMINGRDGGGISREGAVRDVVGR